MSMLMQELLHRLLSHPSLNNTITFNHLQRFIHFTHKLCPEIISNHDQAIVNHTLQLPSHIEAFLASVLTLDISIVKLCWVAFGDLVIRDKDQDIGPSDDDLFREHGFEYKIGL